jgi:hypothetical protein
MRYCIHNLLAPVSDLCAPHARRTVYQPASVLGIDVDSFGMRQNRLGGLSKFRHFLRRRENVLTHCVFEAVLENVRHTRSPMKFNNPRA